MNERELRPAYSSEGTSRVEASRVEAGGKYSTEGSGGREETASDVKAPSWDDFYMSEGKDWADYASEAAGRLLWRSQGMSAYQSEGDLMQSRRRGLDLDAAPQFRTEAGFMSEEPRHLIPKYLSEDGPPAIAMPQYVSEEGPPESASVDLIRKRAGLRPTSSDGFPSVHEPPKDQLQDLSNPSAKGGWGPKGSFGKGSSSSSSATPGGVGPVGAGKGGMSHNPDGLPLEPGRPPTWNQPPVGGAPPLGLCAPYPGGLGVDDLGPPPGGFHAGPPPLGQAAGCRPLFDPPPPQADTSTQAAVDAAFRAGYDLARQQEAAAQRPYLDMHGFPPAGRPPPGDPYANPYADPVSSSRRQQPPHSQPPPHWGAHHGHLAPGPPPGAPPMGLHPPGAPVHGMPGMPPKGGGLPSQNPPKQPQQDAGAAGAQGAGQKKPSSRHTKIAKAISSIDQPQEITTVLIRNLPKGLRQQELVTALDTTGFLDTYDFAYLPCDFQSGQCRGYAFVNFLSPLDATRLKREWQGSTRFQWFPGDPPLELKDAHVQGFEANAVMAQVGKIRNAGFRPLVLHRNGKGGSKGKGNSQQGRGGGAPAQPRPAAPQMGHMGHMGQDASMQGMGGPPPHHGMQVDASAPGAHGMHDLNAFGSLADQLPGWVDMSPTGIGGARGAEGLAGPWDHGKGHARQYPGGPGHGYMQSR